MNKPFLIVGGGPAGLAAAKALANVGQDVTLVEKEESLGGAPILSGYAKLVPTGEWASDAIGGMADAVTEDARINVLTGRTVTEFDCAPGAFTAKLSDDTTLDAS
ncbi:MAG: FAD-dependent oxidoreductase, partial [Rhodospirillaceae bacterium]|nr:FAD-dependent oxidoreductase [Rhodospirillaceae bacterium]